MNIEEINTEKITENIDENLDEKTEKITEKIEILDEKFLNENTEIVEVMNGDNLEIEIIDNISSDVVVHDDINEKNALGTATESIVGMGNGISVAFYYLCGYFSLCLIRWLSMFHIG
jgi:hypothetical protein